MKIIKLMRVLFTLFLIQLQVQAIIFIDIDKFTIDTRSGTRLVVFNTETQSFTHIGYYAAPSTSSSRASSAQIPYSGPHTPFQFNYDGTFSLKEDKDTASNYMIQRKDAEGKLCFSSASLDSFPVISAEDVMKFLNRFINVKNSQPLFEITFNQQGKSDVRHFSYLTFSGSPNPAERGRLGELATDMTMRSLGYSIVASPNASGQGFDGVYEGEGKYLFFTESKCQNESKAASAYMKENLNEKIIYERLHRMPLSNPAKAKILDFVAHSPNNIFKFVQRIQPTGKAQCYVEKLNLFNYQSQLIGDLSPSSPEDLRISACQVIWGKLAGTPLEALTLLLKTFNLPKEEEEKLLSSLVSKRRGDITPLSSPGIKIITPSEMPIVSPISSLSSGESPVGPLPSPLFVEKGVTPIALPSSSPEVSMPDVLPLTPPRIFVSLPVPPFTRKTETPAPLADARPIGSSNKEEEGKLLSSLVSISSPSVKLIPSLEPLMPSPLASIPSGRDVASPLPPPRVGEGGVTPVIPSSGMPDVSMSSPLPLTPSRILASSSVSLFTRKIETPATPSDVRLIASPSGVLHGSSPLIGAGLIGPSFSIPVERKLDFSLVTPAKSVGSSKTVFKAYSLEKLHKLIQNLGKGRPTLVTIYNQYTSKKVLSDKPFRNLLKGGKAKESEDIWEVFTKNFDTICDEYGLSRETILKKMGD